MNKSPISLLSKLENVTNSGKFSEFDNHEAVYSIIDDNCGLKAYVAVHSTALGPALGGTRFQAYDSEAEAIEDVLRLSKAMSYKCALSNVSFGGGKAVIIKNKGDIRRQLKSYALAIEELSADFKTGTDVGITDDNVKYMAKFCSNMLGVSRADRGDMNTSDSAALGVFYAIKATAEELGGREFNGLKVAIKGVGKLGGKLAQLLSQNGAKIIISDIDHQQLANIKSLLPDAKAVSVDEIHKQQVDIYAPCALGQEFNEVTINQLNCRAIAGGANNQLSSLQAGEAIYRRGILYVPDYIANAGGLIYVADELEPGGFTKSRVLKRIKRIEKTTRAIFERSKIEGVSTYKIADTIAKEKL